MGYLVYGGRRVGFMKGKLNNFIEGEFKCISVFFFLKEEKFLNFREKKFCLW